VIAVSARRSTGGRWLAASGTCAAIVLGLAACGSSKTALSGPAIQGSTLTIYSSLPLQGATAGQAEAIVNGAKLALQDAGSKIGKYTVTYLSLDDSTAATGATSNAAVARNAQRAVSDPTTIAYIGEFNSGATEVSLPILNRVGIAQISPSNTYVGLTTNKPGSLPGEPEKFYPTGKRTFARIVPADDVQGAALAVAAKQAGCKTIEIWNSGTAYSAGLARDLEIATGKAVAKLPGPAGVRIPAPAHALHVAGNIRIDPTASSYALPAKNVTANCFGYESMALALAAIKHVADAHGGQVSRADVVSALLHTQNRHSVIGTYSINADGDTTLASYGLYRIAGGQLMFGKVLDTRKL
jgi:ABC-type branched-subunit amino acid transport system substrate-binding protein